MARAYGVVNYRKKKHLGAEHVDPAPLARVESPDGCIGDWRPVPEDDLAVAEEAIAAAEELVPQPDAPIEPVSDEECRALLPAEQAWELLACVQHVTEDECLALASAAGAGDQAIQVALRRVGVAVRVSRLPDEEMRDRLSVIYGPEPTVEDAGDDDDDDDVFLHLRITGD